MANYSIPNSIPAIGRTSTPLSRRSRKQNSASTSFFATLGLTKTIQPRRLNFFNAQRSIQTVGRWTMSVEGWAFSALWRVKGAWWPSRSSKPLSVPHTRDRGRFDSYPLRQNLCRHPEQSKAKSKNPVAVSRGNSSGFLDFARNDEDWKGGDSTCRVSKYGD
jgi:hypothetical protein